MCEVLFPICSANSQRIKRAENSMGWKFITYYISWTSENNKRKQNHFAFFGADTVQWYLWCFVLKLLCKLPSHNSITTSDKSNPIFNSTTNSLYLSSWLSPIPFFFRAASCCRANLKALFTISTLFSTAMVSTANSLNVIESTNCWMPWADRRGSCLWQTS